MFNLFPLGIDSQARQGDLFFPGVCENYKFSGLLFPHRQSPFPLIPSITVIQILYSSLTLELLSRQSFLISSPNNDMFHSSRWKGMARSMSANPVWNAGSTLHLINAPQPPSTLFPPSLPPPTHTHTPKSILSGALMIYQYSLHLDVYSWSRGALLEYVKYPLPRLNRYHKSNIMEYILHSSVFFLFGLFTEKDRCI